MGKVVACALLAVLSALLSGCAGMRHTLKTPGISQVIRVTSGDRYSFELEENAAAGEHWLARCTDPDVDVIMDHDADSNRVKVTIRVHRGYDGPSEVYFSPARAGTKTPEKDFTITLFKRTGDVAAWE